MSNKNDHDIYIIPPNFIESGTFFGGMFRARNVIEAGILAFAIGVPVFMFVPFGLTTRIIILCLTALPAALVALIGISGESGADISKRRQLVLFEISAESPHRRRRWSAAE